MTTPVYTRKQESDGEKMDMTTPVITKRVSFLHAFPFLSILTQLYVCFKKRRYNQILISQANGNWKMAFVLPSKYGANLPSPKDSSIQLQQIQEKLVAVSAFSGSQKSKNDSYLNILKC